MSQIKKIIRIVRSPSSVEGTQGVVSLNTIGTNCNIKLKSIELPWNNNKSCRSCLPIGDYPAKPFLSRKFGKTYIVLNTHPRTFILFHSGNLAGSRDDGYKTHSLGCILLGLRWGYLAHQKAVLISRKALHTFLYWADGDKILVQLRNMEN